ncbi:TIGR03118 family protein [uncultured Paludibaculum sp.]|uniref:TIGR03118 family protein n=1 Tax=uncultured Paludibaculum sp. TaxID=1765020 RepID=UPI002AAAA88E|nr:TIGR03118 family protein [uncultured Paludibaculum sp.]
MLSLRSSSHPACIPAALVLMVFASPAALPEDSKGASKYVVTNLVSDIAGTAAGTDVRLVNPWGLDRGPAGPWWVADNGTGLSTLYNGAGTTLGLVVTVPSASTGTGVPTGIVFNGTPDFAVNPGQPAAFIFATEDGTISGWNSAAAPTTAVVKAKTTTGAIYKGLAIAQKGGANYLYAANFHGGTVEVFDTNFNPVTLDVGSFVDPEMPEGFAPFNIANLDGKLYVAFAKQDADKEDEVAGKGLGYVTVFDPSGKLLMRLRHVPFLNAPWGLAMAPADFGKFSNLVLVGMFGSGKIAAFDPKDGAFKGLLRGDHGKPIAIDGLWGLRFGNGANAGATNLLFFTAGIQDEAHGLFGSIAAVKKNGGDHDDDGDDNDDDDGGNGHH